MITSGFFLKLSDLGKLNFLIQLINFIFILAIVASIRVKLYVSYNGSSQRTVSIKKLILFTVSVSTISIVALFFLLNTDFFKENFSTFGDLSDSFLMISLAVPGYISYQFLYPVLIEYNLIHQSMKINLLVLIVVALMTYPVIILYGLAGAIALFVLFYTLVLLACLYLYSKLKLISFRD
jgi:O-antigen/teichoic acid export membrane protein